MPAIGDMVEGAPPAGTTIDDKYTVGETLARGGMGCLVKAEHALLKRTVAIKFVLEGRGRSAPRRLLREARAMQALTSEHVVRVFDLGVHEGAPYIVMELLEGEDLADKVAHDGPLPVDEAVDCALEAAAALAEAHAVGIVHRDIKPSNLFVSRTRSRELIKLLDFGISKVLDPEEDDLEQTTEDSVLGTPYYMPPEQIRNPATIDARADVWALAVTLFHLLTGKHPFPAKTAREVTAAIFTDPPLSLRDLRSDAPQGLAEAIVGALAKRPEQRTASIAAFAEELLPFASRRGQDAAALVLATAAEVPVKVRSERVPSAATTTQDGLSSTRSPTHDPTPPETATSTGTERPRHWRLLALAMGGGLVMGWLWLSPDPSPPPSPAVGPAPPAQSSAAPAATGVAPSAEPAFAEPVSAEPAAATAPLASATAGASDKASTLPTVPPRPARRDPPPPTPAPTASASASASAAPRPVDIDGVPIID
jgi:eukaryotic-like serine/threonine-protein kinase